MAELLHKELTQKIIGAAMEVHTELGPGWDEWDYHRAMLHALSMRHLSVASKLKGTLVDHDADIDHFELDLMVEDTVILELKHFQGHLPPASFAQIITYLKFWKKDLGILFNFGLDRLQFKRVPYTPKEGKLKRVGLWSKLREDEREICEKVEKTCESILQDHGLGYVGKTYDGTLRARLNHGGQNPTRPRVNLKFKDIELGTREMKACLLDNRLLLVVTGLYDSTTAADLARTIAYMRQKHLRAGLLINFGKREVQLRAVVQ
ncbi:MAG: GxxExxY protein [Kiritimatiellae bacterium]|nr:GxxExxY protein [Kiritimatiellia bacterium]